MLTMFEIAQKLDIPIVAIRSGGKSDDKEAMKQEIKYLKTLAAGAEARGVTLALNPIPAVQFITLPLPRRY